RKLLLRFFFIKQPSEGSMVGDDQKVFSRKVISEPFDSPNYSKTFQFGCVVILLCSSCSSTCVTDYPFVSFFIFLRLNCSKFLGRGLVTMSLIFAGSIVNPSSPIIKPRYFIWFAAMVHFFGFRYSSFFRSRSKTSFNHSMCSPNVAV